MRIEFVQKGYEMSDKLKEIIQKKLEKLDKYFEEEVKFKVSLKKQGNDCKMELSINVSGLFMRAEVTGESMYDNIDDIIPKIEKQIFKYKTKLQKQFKQQAIQEMKYSQSDILEQKVVRFKRFDLRPMQLEDAIMELDLVDHDFYIYLDEKTNDVSIVYRRDDGQLGLLQQN